MPSKYSPVAGRMTCSYSQVSRSGPPGPLEYPSMETVHHVIIRRSLMTVRLLQVPGLIAGQVASPLMNVVNGSPYGDLLSYLGVRSTGTGTRRERRYSPRP